MTVGEKFVLAGIAVAGATIGVTTSIAAVLAVLQEVRLVDSVEYRLATHSRNFFWIATTIGAVSTAPLVKEVIGYLGYDSTSKQRRRLRPMWQAMVSMFPDSRLPLDSGESKRRITKVQLHRTTVEIRDAILRLRPHCREIDPSQFASFVASEHVPVREHESARLALQLVAAARDRSEMQDRRGDVVGMTAPSLSASLDDEVAELLSLARWWVAARRFVATRHSSDIEFSSESAR
ncbi:DUF6545 domain-containing protein [Nocardia xishanensis]|uniref:DUF6545 domain-containing protein n=1 Tax=Nocardia xishanensis TaxID=238964 RepID=UPI00342AD5B7